jgi:hypothetical protein
MQLPDQCALRSRLRAVNSTRLTENWRRNVGDVEFTDGADRELRQRAHAQGLTPFPGRWTVKVPYALTCAS